MSEKQKQLVAEITANVEKLPPEKQYQLLGVAQGLGMVPGPKQAGESPAAEKKRSCGGKGQGD